MNVLAINTSDNWLSVALSLNGTVTHEDLKAERNHNQSVLLLTEKLLARSELKLSQIDAVAFGVGPGSFTGLRIAAGVAQGIAFGVEVPVVPVSCMLAIAQKQAGDKVIVAIDAKRSSIYWGRYLRDASGWMQLDEEEKLTPVTDLDVVGNGWFGAGSGWDVYADRMLTESSIQLSGWAKGQSSHAIEIAKLGAHDMTKGQGRDAHLAIPNYHSPYFTKPHH